MLFILLLSLSFIEISISKLVFITGGNAGLGNDHDDNEDTYAIDVYQHHLTIFCCIGLQTAKSLLRQGYEVIITARSESKAEEAIKDIKLVMSIFRRKLYTIFSI